MSNEQCGMCWDLEFDKHGNKTHESRHHHDFIPLDYCIKCGMPQYDQQGHLTHPYVVHGFNEAQIVGLPHKFVSTIQAENKAKRQKRQIFFAIIGGTVMGIVTVVNISNLFI